MPFGAEVVEDGRVRFRLWAPAAQSATLRLFDSGGTREIPVPRDPDGWYEETVDTAPGARYAYVVDGELAIPDPASRYQPEDVHGPSEVVDPRAFAWEEEGWRGRPWEETVLYEIHTGTFTPQGTFAGVAGRLDALAELGVTGLELMPVADFPGRRNWGYDGVLPFAPDAAYGRPEDLKALVQAAHRRGLMVFLDVVYNHFGPEGNYLHRIAPPFFTERYHTPWGAAINYDGEGSRTVRDFFVNNTLFWIEEYRIDGIRFDAVHAIFDESKPDILEEIAEAVHARVGEDRHVHLVLENDHNAARYLERRDGGRARWYVAQWNDDIHHIAHHLATGETGGYYADYADDPARRLGRALTEGFDYQGEPSPYREGERRGEASAHLPPTAFVSFLQNHDQVGNRAFGERITHVAGDEAVKAAVAALLLAPSPPLLFMGEDWAAPQPFLFFCDFEPGLADSVREGRRREFTRFPEFRDEAARARIPDPNLAETFERTVLNWDDRRIAPHSGWLDFYRGLLEVRHGEIVPRLRGIGGHASRFERLGGRALRAEWRLGDGSRLVLVANMGAEPVETRSPPPQGQAIWATSGDALRRLDDGVIAEWSVAWFVEDGRR